MARKLFEKQGIRRRNGQLASGVTYVVYTDVAGTALADISATSGGPAIAGSEITTADIAGLGPAAFRFYGPTSGQDTLFLRCPADTSLGVQEIEADEDERLDALEAGGGGGGDVAAHEADTTGIHGITDTAQLATLNTAQTVSGAKTFTGGQPWHDVAGTGDGRIVADGAITSGLAVLTSATAAFATTDVGKTIWVAGAGAAGVVLSSTILSRQSATQVTLVATASVTVTGAGVVWGTDYSTAAEAAFDAAEAVGTGEVRFGPGGWITSLRLFRSNTTLSGAGMNATKIIKLPASNGDSLGGNSLTNVEIRDLTIDANRSMQTTGEGSLVLNGCSASAVRRVRVRNTRGRAINIFNCSDSVVEGCEVNNIGTLTPASDGSQAGIAVTSGSIRIRVLGCRVDTIRDSGIRISSATEVAIGGNTVKTVTGIGIALGTGSQRCAIDGNTVNDVGDTGIDVGNSVDSATTGNTVIAAGAGIIGDGCSRHACVGNTVISTTGTDLPNSGAGIAFGSATLQRSIVVTDNTVHLSYGHGIALDGVSDSVIANNTVSDSSVTHTGRSGISMIASSANSQNNLITGNRCYDTRGTKRQAYGLVMSGTNAGGSRVTNNDFTGNLTGAISDTAGVPSYKYGNTGALDQTTIDITPLNLSGTLRWFAADRIPGVAHGEAVATWPDLSGNSGHATQATGGKQPLLQAGLYNGLPAVRFDGTDDTLGTVAAGFATSAARTVIAVGRSTDLGAGPVRLWGLGNAQASVFLNNGATWGYYANEAAGVVDLGGGPATVSVVSVVYASASSAAAYVNGGTATSFDPADSFSTSQVIALGNSTAAGTDYWKGDLAELVLFNRALTTAERQTIERYLGRKYGITVA